MNIPDFDVLKKNILFRTMSDDDIREVVDTMEPHVRKFRKNDMIAQDGDHVTSMAIVLSGCVHLFHIDPNGNSNLLDVLGPGI